MYNCCSWKKNASVLFLKCPFQPLGYVHEALVYAKEYLKGNPDDKRISANKREYERIIGTELQQLRGETESWVDVAKWADYPEFDFMRNVGSFTVGTLKQLKRVYPRTRRIQSKEAVDTSMIMKNSAGERTFSVFFSISQLSLYF